MDNKTKLDLLKELNNIYKIGNSLDLAAVSLEIAPEDPIFSQEYHYFNVGFSGLQCIRQALFSAQKDKAEIKTILDFPSGHGRVLRFLRAYFPEAQITASEIDEDALKFCCEQFKANTLISHKEFDKIEIEQKFDLIWCGSLITHLSEENSKKLLEFFFKALNDKGVLVITSHGRFVKEKLEDSEKARVYGLSASQALHVLQQYETAGYGYADYTGVADYGLSITKPSWIIKLLEDNKGFKIISYTEQCWDNHQDVMACVKESGQPFKVEYTKKKPEGLINRLSGEEIARQIPVKKLVKAVGFKIATKPGLRWLYRYRSLGKKVLGE